jgi:ATP phosphoribosyltransferase regulatory subunit HisZ
MDMSILDSLLSQVSEHVDVKNLASKVGLKPEQVETAVASLAKAHPAPGDTVATAAASSGIEQGKLSQIVEQIGGEGALGKVSQMLNDDQSLLGKVSGFLDRDGDGNPLNDITGMAKGLFSKN